MSHYQRRPKLSGELVNNRAEYTFGQWAARPPGATNNTPHDAATDSCSERRSARASAQTARTRSVALVSARTHSVRAPRVHRSLSRQRLLQQVVVSCKLSTESFVSKRSLLQQFSSRRRNSARLQMTSPFLFFSFSFLNLFS